MGHTDRSALVIFGREPRLGRVKTRLAASLGAQQALALHCACVQATARVAASLPRSVDLWLYLTSSTPAAARLVARRLNLPQWLKVRVQGRGNLGTRLARALAELAAAGYSRVVVIGTDSPTLSSGRLRRAFALLGRADAVLGPARDGGYYLIGLQPRAANLRRLFRGIEWGTPRTFRQTRQRIRAARLRLRLLPVGDDVDTAADLARLRRALRGRRGLQPLRRFFARLPKQH
jgi:rSAM/selenodomain-associated transferase 1